MTGLEIVGAGVWLIVTLIVLSWGGGLIFSGVLIKIFSGNGSKVGSIWLIVGCILIGASVYSTHLWLNAIHN